MKYPELTGIGRPLDPNYPTNIAIVVLSIIVLLLTGSIALLGGADFLSAALDALRSSVIFFMGWAITREYDPDHPYSAFLAAIAMLITFLLGYKGNLLFLAFLGLMLRYINRSTGIPATIVDLTAGWLLTAWLSWSMDWTVGALGAVAFTLDAIHAEKQRVRYAFAGLSLAAAVFGAFRGQGNTNFVGISNQVLVLAGGFVVLGLPLLRSYQEVKSVGDFNAEPLEKARVQAALVFYIGSTVLIGMKLGVQSTGVMILTGSVIAATAVYYVLSLFFPPLLPDDH
jgi:hypothetical protein